MRMLKIFTIDLNRTINNSKDTSEIGLCPLFLRKEDRNVQ